MKLENYMKTTRNKAKSSNALLDFAEKRKTDKEKLIELFGDGFDQMTIYGGVPMSVAEAKTIENWLQSLKPRILEIQKHSTLPSYLVADEPYYGATGGGVTVMCTPTSLGNSICVQESITKEILNVSDATHWFFYG